MDKKEHIIQAAMKLLIENGVQGTPMSAIAKAADAGMGTIYNYFPNKEDLINAIYIYIKQEEKNSIGMAQEGEPVKKQFEYFYRTMIQHLVAKPTHFWFIEQFFASPVITDATRAEGVRIFADLAAVMKQGQKQGIIKSINLEEQLQFVHGGFRAFIRWILISGKPLTKQRMDDQLRIAWDTIKE